MSGIPHELGFDVSRNGNVAGARPANTRIWTGRIISGLVVAFLLFDTSARFSGVPWPSRPMPARLRRGGRVGIGLLLLSCVIVYLVPRTAVLGAVLLTGYFGGAICTHVRTSKARSPLSSS